LGRLAFVRSRPVGPLLANKPGEVSRDQENSPEPNGKRALDPKTAPARKRRKWRWLIWTAAGLAVLLIAGRIAHPVGMARKAPNPFRAGGAILTWVVITLASLDALRIAL